MISRNIVHLHNVRSEQQPAGILTKIVPVETLRLLISLLFFVYRLSSSGTAQPATEVFKIRTNCKSPNILSVSISVYSLSRKRGYPSMGLEDFSDKKVPEFVFRDGVHL